MRSMLHAQCAFCWLLSYFHSKTQKPRNQTICAHSIRIMISSKCHRRCEKHLKYLFMVHFWSTFYHQIAHKTGFISHPISQYAQCTSGFVLIIWAVFNGGQIPNNFTQTHRHERHKHCTVSIISRRMQYQNNDNIPFNSVSKTKPQIFDT